MIPMSECVERGVYRIYSRNLLVGVYDGKGGFIGIRQKFGHRYLFTEYHWEHDPHFGTVRPEALIEMLPAEIEVRERANEPTRCSKHGRECAWTGSPVRVAGRIVPAPWVHVDDGSELVGHDSPIAAGTYQPLFDYLDPIQARVVAELDAEERD